MKPERNDKLPRQQYIPKPEAENRFVSWPKLKAHPKAPISKKRRLCRTLHVPSRDSPSSAADCLPHATWSDSILQGRVIEENDKRNAVAAKGKNKTLKKRY
eukprot:GHVT01013445.1.p1 GENE.GHVT01013445.1~~GHVT01013445.1.p1  ORF type:complete len:101 (-),score=15.57 GHVT01013445.1:58-360(-)